MTSAQPGVAARTAATSMGRGASESPLLPLITCPASSTLALQQRAAGPQLLHLLRADGRIREIELCERLDDCRRHHEPGEPLVVCGHYEPRRMFRGGRPYRLLIGRHVVRPEGALAHIGRRELPVLVGFVEPLEESFLLLAARDVQEELEHDQSLMAQVPFEMRDVGKPLLPDVLACAGSGQLLLLEDVLVHSHDQDLLVVRAIENADVAALGQATGMPPEKVVIEILRRGLFEGKNLATLRVDTRHHVLDGAVLPDGVHGLKDQQQRPAVLRIKQFLLLGQPVLTAVEELGSLALVQLQPAGIAGIEIFQPESLAARDTERLYVVLEALEDLIAPHTAAFMTCQPAKRTLGDQRPPCNRSMCVEK